MQVHRETLEEEATHVTDEAHVAARRAGGAGVSACRRVQRALQALRGNRQLFFLVAFVLLALAMGLVMAPAAYHRQVGRGRCRGASSIILLTRHGHVDGIRPARFRGRAELSLLSTASPRPTAW